MCFSARLVAPCVVPGRNRGKFLVSILFFRANQKETSIGDFVTSDGEEAGSSHIVSGSKKCPGFTAPLFCRLLHSCIWVTLLAAFANDTSRVWGTEMLAHGKNFNVNNSITNS
jgi:hypothetical protein